MYNTGYPTSNFSWRDDSGARSDVLFSAQQDGLNVPFAFIMAERGKPGAIYYGGASELTPVLGQSTFDPGSPYFNASTRFAATQMAGQGVELMRLVDAEAKIATLGLFVSVTPADIIQYKKNADGSRIFDNQGRFVPQLKVDGVTKVTQPGVILKWSVRQLEDDETPGRLIKKVVNVGGVDTTTYPIMDFQMTSPGKYGNRQGFTLYSTSSQDSSVSQAIDSVLYRFVPMELPREVSTTASAIEDVFGSQFNDVSFKPSAIYGQTNTNYAFSYILANNYVNAQSGDNKLPYNVNTYSQFVKEIGEDCLVVSPELGDIDPYMIDLIATVDGNGNLYDHIELDTASTGVVNNVVVNYALGGTDGDTSWAKFEELVADWLASGQYGEFTNLQQHPMTHFSDPGFSMSTKTLLLTMLDLRDNFKIDLSTQDISLPTNTKAEDIAAGQALVFRAQMHPESIINGVGCCRVGIYAHAGELVAGSPYGGMVPFTYNRAIQRRNLDGGSYIKGSSGGLPNSEVTLFRKANWVADDESSQKLAWANCINTVRHASRTQIFYPSLRTVYPNDTSLLSDDEISDRIIYMFKICRFVWAKYAGVRRPAEKLYPLIQDDITNLCALAFAGDNINVQARVYQTANDANLGSQISIQLSVTGSLPVRIMNFNVAVSRAVS